MPPIFSQRVLIAGLAPIPVIEKGYWGGGQAALFGGNYNQIDGVDFVTEAAINPSSTLSLARGSSPSSSLSKGYFGGGKLASLGTTNIIDGMVFETEVAFNPSATMAGGTRGGMGGVSSFETEKGYWGGGSTSFSSAPQTTIDGIRYDNDAAINPAASLSLARTYIGGTNSNAKGYFGGGRQNFGPANSDIDAIRFDTETSNNPSAVLSLARVAPAGCSSETRCYWAGGSNHVNDTGQVYYNNIDGMIFSSEAAVNPSLVLSRVKFTVGGVSAELKGYWGGGDVQSAQYDDIDGIIFSTETAENISANLSITRGFTSGIQAWPQY